MTLEFRLPDVGEGLEEAEVIRWLVAPGDEVARDQSVVEIQTDKALVEIPAPEAGRITILAVAEGAVVKVGELLFVLEESGRAGSGQAVEDPAVPVSSRSDQPASGASPPASVPPVQETVGGRRPRGRFRPKAAPAVRKLAADLGVDLAVVEGSGPAGRILKEDVQRTAEDVQRTAEDVQRTAEDVQRTAEDAVPAAPAGAVGEAAAADLGRVAFGAQPLRGIRRVSARTMVQSWSTIPHIHGYDEIDATDLLEARRRLEEPVRERGTHLTLASFFVLAAARALRRFPLVNASIDLEEERIVVHEAVHIGLAVATADGLIVPVVRDADRLGLLEMAEEVERLTALTRERRITPGELRGGTFTITNYGSLGGRFASPLIRPPEAGILGFGAIRERPLVVAGEVVARPALPICFGADHRLIDGDLSVAFQECIKSLLSDPLYLLLGG